MFERKEGKGHRVYIIDLLVTKIFMRIKKNRDVDLELERIPEYEVLEYLRSNGLSVPSTYFKTNKIMIQNYIENTKFDEIKDIDEYFMKKSNMLRAIHRLDIGSLNGYSEYKNSKQFYYYLVKSLLDFYKRYDKVLIENNIRRDEIEILWGKCDLISERNLTLCHGDVQESNFMFHKENISVIDWEHALIGDPYYDLSLLYCRASYPEDQKNKIICDYFGETEIPLLELGLYIEIERLRKECVKIVRKNI